MNTYGGRDARKPGIDLSRHALIVTEGVSGPHYQLDEMTQNTVRVRPDSHGDELDPKSLVDFSKVYTVEH